MTRLAQIVGELACLLLPLVEARAEFDPLASKAAEEFLKGLTLIDLPEGKALHSRNSWLQWVSIPVLLKYETLFEGMFETDIPAIRGYKRLIGAEMRKLLNGSVHLAHHYSRYAHFWTSSKHCPITR